MLVMDVPTDINQIDPKQWFGLTGRQFLCVVGASYAPWARSSASSSPPAR